MTAALALVPDLPAQDDAAIVWAVYLRLSKLKSRRHRAGRQRGRFRAADESVQRQLAIIRAWAEPRGITIPDDLVFVDNGLSAWKPDSYRPAWDAMLKAGAAGEFGGLLVWKLDRFTRNIRDGEDLVDLGVLVDGPESGRIDLSTTQGKSVVRQQFEKATNASNETSDKVNATFADMRASGYRLGGRRAFGTVLLSDAEFDPDDDTTPAVVWDEDEAAEVLSLARRVTAGESSADICRDLNARGILTTEGGPWNQKNLTQMLENPLYGGYQVYKGETIGRLTNVTPILDAETYAALHDKLDSRRIGRRATGQYPYSGELWCGNPECPRQGTMAGHKRRKKNDNGGWRTYLCAKSSGGCGQSVLAEPVEAIIREVVLARWGDAAVRAAIAAADTAQDERRAELRALLGDLADDMAEVEDKLYRVPREQTVRRERLASTLRSMETRWAEAQADLDALGTAPSATASEPALAEVPTPDEWDRGEPADKVAAMKRLHLRFTIGAADPRRAVREGFDSRRVRWATV